jgi:uncharacterized flavoprotein (TIGR03862 family)
MGMSEGRAIVIGAGPGGLMAAEVLLEAGVSVTVLDRMPSPGRKFLMAGRGGLNLTHSEPFEAFAKKYGSARPYLLPALADFPAESLRAWSESLGQPTFIGSSGRIFPAAMKASPLLRSWMSRLTDLGAQFRFRETWTGWSEDGALMFETEPGERHETTADAVVLALGGASWPRLGSDGRWVEILQASGVGVTPFAPTNVGFNVDWSETFRTRFAGEPLKAIGLEFQGRTRTGEIMISLTGIQGGGVYALSRDLRESLDAGLETILHVDLRPGLTRDEIIRRLERVRSGDSLSNRLRKALRFSPTEVAFLREGFAGNLQALSRGLAESIKAVPVQCTAAQSLERAISSAGGVQFGSVNADLMLTARPGVFLAGEMLDWEAPTGGYLLQACFATGRAAGLAALRYIRAG